MFKFSDMNDSDVLIAVFRESIGLAIPQIIGLISDGESDVCCAGADALVKLSEQGNVSKFLS